MNGEGRRRVGALAAVVAMCLVACGKKGESPAAEEDNGDEREAAPSSAAAGAPDESAAAPSSSAAADAGAPLDERALRAKRADCNALVRAANHEQRFLAGATRQLATSDEGNLEALGDALDDSGGRIASVGLHDPELRRIQRDYREMFSRGAAISRRVALALRSKDDKALAAAKAGLAELGRDEARIAQELGAYCRRR